MNSVSQCFVVVLFTLGIQVTFAQSQQDVEEEDLLEFIADGLATCNDVKKVEREGLDFRVYSSLAPFLYEFSLEDARADKVKYKSQTTLSLTCGAPGCISQFQPAIVSQGWHVTKKLNSFIWRCEGAQMAHRLSTIIRGHRQMFQ